MSVVSLLGVKVLNNPAPFLDQYQFEITFECLEPLRQDLDWKLTYVGSATSTKHDQELDSLLVGPIPVGVNRFVFVADAPDLSRIPSSEILGVTVILLSCSYDGREFVRVGYYVNNEYDSDELNADPPTRPVIEHVRRNVLAEKPRVTRFTIKWDSEETAPALPPDQPEADLLEDDGTAYGADEEDDEDDEEGEVEEGPESAKADAHSGGDVQMGVDAEMAGAEDTSGPVNKRKMAGTTKTAAAKVGHGQDPSVVPTTTEIPSDEDEEDDDAGSEDIDTDSTGSDEEDLDDEESAVDDGDEDMEMGDVGPSSSSTDHLQSSSATVTTTAAAVSSPSTSTPHPGLQQQQQQQSGASGQGQENNPAVKVF